MTVTSAILIICIGLFGLSLVVGSFAMQFGMIPAAVAKGEWWRLITSTFLHFGVLHLFFNMLALYWLGPPTERALGSARFAALFLLSALGGSVASYWFSDRRTLSTGASGGLFGMVAAMIVMGQKMRADVSQLVFLLAVNVVYGFVMSGVDWRAHFGGAITGAALAWIYASDRSVQTQQAGVAGVFGFLILAALARTARF
jgi:membrane associated rhomboid family serine protease